MDSLLIPADQRFPFQLDEEGRVWRWSAVRMAWRVVEPSTKSDGYQVVVWNGPKGRKTIYFHRLVWELSNGKVPSGKEIDHIDGVKSNNALSNLRVVSHRENIQAARERLGNWSTHNTKLKPHQRALVVALPSTADWKALAERWGVHKVTLLTIRCKAKKVGQAFV